MLWSDFVAEVNAQLAVDANRRGIESFRDRFIRNAVLDLQRFIPGFRQGLTTTYGVNNVAEQGKASLVQFPSGCKPKELWQYSTAAGDDPLCKRHRLDFYPWASRKDLVCGKLDFLTWFTGCPAVNQSPPCNASAQVAWCERKGYVYTISPHGTNALVYPAINADTALLLIWDGYKTSFVNGDTVPFFDGTSEAVAAYLRWQIALTVDKSPVLAREHYSFWKERRLSLYRDWQDTQDAEGKGDEYANNPFAPLAVAGLQTGSINLVQGQASQAIVFPLPFSVLPIVDCWIVGPNGAAFAINAFPDASSITLAGFTAIFAAAIPDNSGYKVYWNAVPPQP